MSGATLVCVPGGGSLAVDTFDAAPLARDGYSLLKAMTDRGRHVVLTDLPGVLDGTPGDDVSMALAGEALAVAASGAPGSPVIGVGHSLGGAVVVRAQASQRPFDALVLLGYSPAWRSVRDGDGRPREDDDAGVIAWTAARLAADDPALWAKDTVRFPERLGFGTLNDVPAEVTGWASSRAVGVPRRLAQEFGIPEPRLRDARSVDVPVLLVFGEVDAATDPAQEPLHYPNAPVTLERLPASGHAHHLASSRARLWDLIDHWLRTVLSDDAEEAP